jgi:hypothetical protein
MLCGRVIIQQGMLGLICKNQCILEKSRIFLLKSLVFGESRAFLWLFVRRGISFQRR